MDFRVVVRHASDYIVCHPIIIDHGERSHEHPKCVLVVQFEKDAVGRRGEERFTSPGPEEVHHIVSETLEHIQAEHLLGSRHGDAVNLAVFGTLKLKVLMVYKKSSRSEVRRSIRQKRRSGSEQTPVFHLYL